MKHEKGPYPWKNVAVVIDQDGKTTEIPVPDIRRGRSEFNIISAIAYARAGKRVLIACETELRKKTIADQLAGQGVEVRIVDAGVLVSPRV